jgi:class 3 adenylate cyclase/tetratricopeptide (TPR) repeat protein
MRCLSCQAILPEAAKFCIECGATAPAVCAVCAVCGFGNLSAARYCAACGAKLPERAADTRDLPTATQSESGGDPSVERRQLTVMFCDLVGSTVLASRLDPEELREVIGAFYQCIADTVVLYGGFVARYTGDGAMVYYGYPQGYEDNAERAIRAALALLSNVTALDVHGERLRLRIGIATGLVVVGEVISAGAAREQTALGATPNLAARLQALAQPNTIAIAESTRRLASGMFEFRDLGEVALAGFAAPQRAWQVIREESSAQFRAYDSHKLHQDTPPYVVETRALVGRVQELQLLRDYWKQVREGRGRVVLVLGEPGIGKSRLLKVFAADLEQEPYAYLEFGCAAQHENSPLYPVIALLPTVLEWSRQDTLDVKRQKLEAFCVRHRLPPGEGLSLLGALLSLPASDRSPALPMSPERQRQRTLQVLAAIVFSYAAEKPLMIVVEDLHWMDPTSKQLLDLVIDQVPTVPLFLLLAARLDFAPQWPAQSYLSTMTLTRLSANEVETMASELAGSKPLPAEIVNEVVAKTDGVPLFVEELVKEVLDSGLTRAEEHRHVLTGPLPPLAIPTTLQDLLAARLDHLGNAKAFAQLCATLGREFAFSLLKAVSGLDDATLERSLSRLVHAELLHQRCVSADAVYVFKHAMIQEAAYQSLLKSRRRQYHERIAHVFVEEFAHEAELHSEVVALHFTRAGEIYSAVTWWQKAGQRAFRHASYAEAIAHYEDGLRALESATDERRRNEAELSLQVELGYSLIPLRGWGAAETAEAFNRAGELCRQHADTPSRLRALWGVGAFWFVRGDQRKSREIAEQCLDLARGVDDEDALIEAHYLLGIVRCVQGDFPSGCADLETAIRLYGVQPRETHRLLYGQDAKASALGWLAMARWALGNPDEALAIAREAVEFVRDTTQPFLRARSLAAVGFVRLFRRERQELEMELPEALALCVEQRFSYFHAIVSAFQGANLVLLGDISEGIELMQKNLQLLRAMGTEVLSTIILTNLASAHLALEQIDAARSVVDEGLTYVAQSGERWGESELLRLRGELFDIRGETAEAERSLRRALDVARAQQAKSYELRSAIALAQHWAHHDNRNDARTLLAQTLEAWSPTMESADLRDARALCSPTL